MNAYLKYKEEKERWKKMTDLEKKQYFNIKYSEPIKKERIQFSISEEAKEMFKKMFKNEKER